MTKHRDDYRLVNVKGSGIGVIEPDTWARMPEELKTENHIEVLATNEEVVIRAAYHSHPDKYNWRDSGHIAPKNKK